MIFHFVVVVAASVVVVPVAVIVVVARPLVQYFVMANEFFTYICIKLLWYILSK